MPTHLRKILAGGQLLVALGELADDLIRRVPPALAGCHGAAILPALTGNEVAQHLDHYEGLSSETAGHPEYRIVVREVGGTIEIIEVVTVEERADDLANLLAGVRLGRITDPIRRSDTDRKIARIRKLRSGSSTPPTTPTKGSDTSP
jgi:hypothetical protein